MAIARPRRNSTLPTPNNPPPNQPVRIAVPPTNWQVGEFVVEGDAPLVQHAFSKRPIAAIRAIQEAGSQARKGKKREKRNFQQDYEDSMHTSVGGWHGVPASGCRSALIEACTLVGFHKTVAKKTLFVLADGYEEGGTPLVRIIRGKPEPTGPQPARNDDGSIDLRNRAIWHEWAIRLRVRYDADFFSLTDVTNLVNRAFEQVGICEGRPFSKNSAGMGWGTGKIVNK